MTIRISLLVTLLFSACIVNAQDSTAKRNEIFTKLNPFAGAFLNNYANADFALGYKRYTKNFNLRAYASYRSEPYNFFSNHMYYNAEDSSITHYQYSEYQYSVHAGIERITKWPRKLRLYYGADIGFAYVDAHDQESYSKVYDSTEDVTVEQFQYIKPNLRPFIGLRYDISPRFVASLEMAAVFSYYRPRSTVLFLNDVNWNHEGPIDINSSKLDHGNTFSFEIAPFALWLGFRL